MTGREAGPDHGEGSIDREKARAEIKNERDQGRILSATERSSSYSRATRSEVLLGILLREDDLGNFLFAHILIIHRREINPQRHETHAVLELCQDREDYLQSFILGSFLFVCIQTTQAFRMNSLS